MINASSFEILNTNENGGNDAVIVAVLLFAKRVQLSSKCDISLCTILADCSMSSNMI